MIAPHRDHPAYLTFFVHRLSGVVLALFLPAHFLVMALALRAEVLDGFFRWTDRPLVQLAEATLVGVLAVHVGCGLRLLAIEFLRRSDQRARGAALAIASSIVLGALFLVDVLL